MSSLSVTTRTTGPTRCDVESVGQAAAGALVLAVGVAELVLGFWTAGVWQRSAGLLVATIGAACLARGVARVATRKSGWS